MITLILSAEGILHQPLLHLSLYLKEHRQEYDELLDVVCREGDWERWLAFFVVAVETTAAGAALTAQKIAGAFAQDRRQVERLGRGAGPALAVHHELQRRPLAGLAGLRIVEEITERRRDRIFACTRYLALLQA